MPLMTSIRERLTTFFSVFAGLFVVYIVLDWGMDITGRRHNQQAQAGLEVGKIDGEPVTYKDFSEIVRQMSDNQKTQTGTEPDENQMRAIRDQVWNQLVEQRLFDEEATRFNISVTDQELVDWVNGDNPPDFLRSQFVDSTGTFDRQRYQSALSDPRNKKQLLTVEDFLRRQRLREKLQSTVLASVRVTEDEIVQRFMDQNIKCDGDYILFDPALLVKDDEVKISDDDLRRYYNDHTGEYKVDATRKLKYVLFVEQASHADSEGVLTEMQDIVKRTKAGADFTELAKTYSETPVSDAYFKHGDFAEPRNSAVFAAKAGDLIGPTLEGDGYHLVKVLDFRAGKDDYINARHILVNIENNDSVAALKSAKDLFARAKRGEDFAGLARKYSKDAGSGARGGDLGWFGKGRMVKQFEEAAFKARPGQIVGPVRSQFGYHIIQVIAKDNREVKVADIRMSITPSSRTKSDLTQHAQEFSYFAQQGDFVKEAEKDKYGVSETPAFSKNGIIPGIGMNSTVNKFAFNGKAGAISEPLSVQTGTAVFMISEAKEAGIRPFDELKTSIETQLRREKKMEKVKALAAELRQGISPADSLQKIAQRRPGLLVQHLPPFAIGSFIPGLGRDPGFIGGITDLNVGEISKPIEGQRGVFLARLTSRTPFDSTSYKVQKDALRAQLLSEKRSRFLTGWSEQLKKTADIVDNRDQFYK
jgi:peptidyl-prolyl cis-trans isomerase D